MYVRTSRQFLVSNIHNCIELSGIKTLDDHKYNRCFADGSVLASISFHDYSAHTRTLFQELDKHSEWLTVKQVLLMPREKWSTRAEIKYVYKLLNPIKDCSVTPSPSGLL